ncbi:MAG: PstC family ABC transporter permease [Bacilli bacterium]
MLVAKRKLITDNLVHTLFLILTILCSLSIVLIVGIIVVKGTRPFLVPYGDGVRANLISFLFSLNYIQGVYGVLGIAINTVVIVFFAALIALPISVLTALFVVRIAPKVLGNAIQIVVELLAAVPSIIFGLFGMGVINPIVRDLALLFGFQTAGGVSTLSVILVLVIMILPTITTLAITSMRAVREEQIHASLALGATMTQTNFKVVVFGAKSGIIAALILGVGRALGEATAVSMVCGGATSVSLGLFSPTSTITSKMLQGIHESSGLNYDIRFSLGIVLIVIILVSNALLNLLKKRISRHEEV